MDPAEVSPNCHKAVLGVAVFCVSGTLLTIVNKIAVKLFPFTFMLLVIQNAVTVILLLLLPYCTTLALPALDITTFRRWFPLSCLFITMLFSSLEALKYVSATTFVVLRNLGTIVVACLEYAILGTELSFSRKVSVVGMLLGATLFGSLDISYHNAGYAWLCVNILSSSIYQVYVKFLAHDVSLSPMGMSYISNSISLPLLGGCSVLMKEYMLLRMPSGGDGLVIVVSGMLGFCLSTSAFFLNQTISATSITVANNANKFAVILFSEVFLGRTLGWLSSAGTIVVLFFAFYYQRNGNMDIDHVESKGVVVLLILTWGMLSFTLSSFSLTGPNTRPSTQPGVHMVKPMPSYIHGQFNHCRIAQESPLFQDCDTACPAFVKNGFGNFHLPTVANYSQSTQDIIDSVLLAAWGPSPPSVDVFLRTGCHGAAEAEYLFKSIDIFWPRFLGSVVVLLDYANQYNVSSIVPREPRHHYVIAFEHAPCMPPRVFNQVSYLMADLHSSADYIVTIDSDCVLYTPVTPDLLFRHGKILLPHSRAFQEGMWIRPVEFFLGTGTYKFHTMVSQPVTFHRKTFHAYRHWVQNKTGKCLIDRVAEFVSDVPDQIGVFCWMCQLGTFVSTTNITADYYQFVSLDDGSQIPYQRFSAHVTYELSGLSFQTASLTYMREGVCRVLGEFQPPECHETNVAKINELDFAYAGWPWFQSRDASKMQKDAVRHKYLSQIRKHVLVATNASTYKQSNDK